MYLSPRNVRGTPGAVMDPQECGAQAAPLVGVICIFAMGASCPFCRSLYKILCILLFI